VRAGLLDTGRYVGGRDRCNSSGTRERSPRMRENLSGRVGLPVRLARKVKRRLRLRQLLTPSTFTQRRYCRLERNGTPPRETPAGTVAANPGTVYHAVTAPWHVPFVASMCQCRLNFPGQPVHGPDPQFATGPGSCSRSAPAVQVLGSEPAGWLEH